MSEQSGSSNLKRFSFGDHIPIVIAADVDNNEINALYEQISSCCEFLLGGRATVTYSREVKFVSSLLYYMISIHEDHCTLGQDFSGIRMIQSRIFNASVPHERDGIKSNPVGSGLLETVLKEFNNIFRPSSRTVYSPLNIQKGDTLYAAALMSFLPYLNSRKTDISSLLGECYTALTAKEEDQPATTTIINTDGRSSSTIFSSSSSSNILAAAATSSSSSSHHNIPSMRDTAPAEVVASPISQTTKIKHFITRLVSAYRRFRLSPPYSATGSQGLLGWLEAMHLFWFLRNGSFYYLALRLCGIRLRKSALTGGASGTDLQRANPKLQMSALSFLLGINLIMLSAHAAVHFTSEVLQGDGINDGEDPNHMRNSDSTSSAFSILPVISNTSSQPRGDVLSGLQSSSFRPTEREGEKEEESGNGVRHKETESKGGDVPSANASSSSSMSRKRCPLCMDQVTHPAAPLCGHVFCWGCIHTWINTHSNNHSHSHSSGSDIKCPVCRCLFKREAVRPLFGFS